MTTRRVTEDEIAQRFNTCQALLRVLQENMNTLGYLMLQSKESEDDTE